MSFHVLSGERIALAKTRSHVCSHQGGISHPRSPSSIKLFPICEFDVPEIGLSSDGLALAMLQYGNCTLSRARNEYAL